MWLYPLPSLVALAGWIFMWVTTGWVLLLGGLGVIVSGTVVYFWWKGQGETPKSEIRTPKEVRSPKSE
jgi:hypothetical protein